MDIRLEIIESEKKLRGGGIMIEFEIQKKCKSCGLVYWEDGRINLHSCNALNIRTVRLACPVVLECDKCPVKKHGHCKDNIITGEEAITQPQINTDDTDKLKCQDIIKFFLDRQPIIKGKLMLGSNDGVETYHLPDNITKLWSANIWNMFDDVINNARAKAREMYPINHTCAMSFIDEEIKKAKGLI